METTATRVTSVIFRKCRDEENEKHKPEPNKSPLVAAIRNGSTAEVRALLDTPEGKKLVNATDQQYWARTPLHEACSYVGFPVEVVSLLLEHGANANAVDHNGYKPIDFACREGHSAAIQALLPKTQLSNGDQFKVACCTGDMALLSRAPQYSNLVDNKTGITPLQLACINNQYDAAMFLINNGAVVNPQEEPAYFLDEDTGQHTIPNDNKPDQFNLPLQRACRVGNLQIVELLVNSGADVNAYDDTSTPLNVAVDRGHADIVRYLADRVDGNSINSSEKSLTTPLQRACELGRLDIAEILLAKGANINAGNEKSPLQMAASAGNVELVEFLQRHGARDDPSSNGNGLLHNACWGDSLEMVQKLVASGSSVKATNKKGDTPLHAAVWKGRMGIIEYLIETAKANVNAAAKDGSTPLHVACNRKNLEVAKMLLSHGASANATNEKGETPLFIACELNEKKLVKLLLENNADANKANVDGTSPLHVACSHKEVSIDVMQMLLSHPGININSTDGLNYSTPLHLACKVLDKQKVKLLIEKGANIDAPLKDGDTPLFYAIANKDQNTAMFLIESGANIHVSNAYGKTLLMVVCSFHMNEFAKYLVGCGVDVNKVQGDAITALSIAAANSDIPTLEMLLSHKANPNIQNSGGQTPLYHACIRNDVKVAEILANHGGIFGDVENRPIVKSTYGAKNFKDAKNSEAGKAARKIMVKLGNAQEEKPKSGILSIFSKKSKD